MTEIGVAKPGDLCVLLVPSDSERSSMRKKQQELFDTFGGWIVPEPHVTCQRFNLGSDLRLSPVLEAMQRIVSVLPTFPVFTSSLTEFLSPFWGTYVLRWQIVQDKNWTTFITSIDQTLKSAGCELHYNHEFPFTCSALELPRPVSMNLAQQFQFPQHLFTATKVMITGVLGSDEFETLAEFTMEGIPA